MFHQVILNKRNCVLMFILLLNADQILTKKLTKCPGLYCGRVSQNSGIQNVSECKACPRGYRTDGFNCQKCSSNLSLYDCLYLGFMALLIPVANCHFIYYFEPKATLVVFLHVTTVVESIISAFVSLLAVKPYGQLTLKTCQPTSVKDWYTVFYNPKPDFVNIIHCTQEAVYPLFTIVFIYFAGCLITCLMLRPLVTYLLNDNIPGKKSMYASLYLLPIITGIHAIFSGILYYSFPYLVLVASSIGSAIYLSTREDDIKDIWKNMGSVLIMVMYCLANAYGIVSITLFGDPVRDGILLLLIFLPISFYFLTFHLTDPAKFT